MKVLVYFFLSQVFPFFSVSAQNERTDYIRFVASFKGHKHYFLSSKKQFFFIAVFRR